MANRIIQHHWNPDFSALSPLFMPIADLAMILIKNNKENWPDLSDYQHLLKANVGELYSQQGAAIHFVSQAKKTAHFNHQYESRIYLEGEIQTRTENWHDFFQVLIWCLFPRIKIQLNTLHYQASAKRYSSSGQQNRSAIENALTLFDECGVIIASSDSSLLELIREFRWKELFWRRRAEIEQNLHCVIVGHALYEKALLPYIGMTANALLIDVDESFHSLSRQQQLRQIDDKVSYFLREKNTAINPAMLTPFPLLGMPGWDKNNHNEHFYDNKNYFRDKRRHKPAIS